MRVECLGLTLTGNLIAFCLVLFLSCCGTSMPPVVAKGEGPCWILTWACWWRGIARCILDPLGIAPNAPMAPSRWGWFMFIICCSWGFVFSILFIVLQLLPCLVRLASAAAAVITSSELVSAWVLCGWFVCVCFMSNPLPAAPADDTIVPVLGWRSHSFMPWPWPTRSPEETLDAMLCLGEVLVCAGVLELEVGDDIFVLWCDTEYPEDSDVWPLRRLWTENLRSKSNNSVEALTTLFRTVSNQSPETSKVTKKYEILKGLFPVNSPKSGFFPGLRWCNPSLIAN